MNRRGGRRGRRAKRAAVAWANLDRSPSRRAASEGQSPGRRSVRDRSPTPHEPRRGALRLTERDGTWGMTQDSGDDHDRERSPRRAWLKPRPDEQQEERGDQNYPAEHHPVVFSDEEDKSMVAGYSRRSQDREVRRASPSRSPAGRRPPRASPAPPPGKGGGARRSFVPGKGSPRDGPRGKGGKNE